MHSAIYLLQEPWLLHEFEEDFYGDELRLAVIGYIRPEVRIPYTWKYIVIFSYL